MRWESLEKRRIATCTSRPYGHSLVFCFDSLPNMRPYIVIAASLVCSALAGSLPVLEQTLDAGRREIRVPTAAAPALLQRFPASATATPNVAPRQGSASQSPEPTAVDFSLVTAEPTSWTTTLPGTVVRESITTTQSVAGGPGCEYANGVIAGWVRST